MLRFVRAHAALSSFFAALVVAIATFGYFRPLTLAHWGGHVQLFLAGMHAHTTRVGPYRVRYFEGGEGPPLVLIHGIASSSEDWAMVVGELTKHHRVYAPDLLGYGGTDRPDVDYSIATESDFMLHYLDAMHLARPDVAGWSMGGWIALRIAALHPERVHRLVLTDSAGLRFPTTLNESTFTPKTMEEARALLVLQSDRLAKLPEFIVRDYFRRARREDFVITRGMRSMLEAHDTLDGRLQRVRMPVLLVWGAQDRITPPALVPRLQREIPQAKVVMVPDCGHLAIVECRGEAMPPVVSFLR